METLPFSINIPLILCLLNASGDVVELTVGELWKDKHQGESTDRGLSNV